MVAPLTIEMPSTTGLTPEAEAAAFEAISTSFGRKLDTHHAEDVNKGVNCRGCYEDHKACMFPRQSGSRWYCCDGVDISG